MQLEEPLPVSTVPTGLSTADTLVGLPPAKAAARTRRGGGAVAPRRGFPTRRRLAEQVTAYGLLCAALVLFALFSWYPIVRGVLLSFQQVNFVGPPTWVGLDNFRRLFDDPLFFTAWKNTLQFTGFALVIGFVVPFATAIVLNELRHATAYFRLVVYLPVMLPPIVSAMLWQFFYDPGQGLFNTLLHGAHLPASQWLDSTSTAMLSLVLVSTWANMGSSTLIYLAALQTIPGELYEAAELDGAGLWQRTGGGPEDSTVTVLLLLYRYAFVYNDFGTASAMSVLLFLVLGAFSAAYLRLTSRAR